MILGIKSVKLNQAMATWGKLSDLICDTVLLCLVLGDVQMKCSCSRVQVVHFLQIMLVGFIHWKHLVFSINSPPQFLHDSSGIRIQRKLMKIRYKQHVQVVHIKAL